MKKKLFATMFIIAAVLVLSSLSYFAVVRNNQTDTADDRRYDYQFEDRIAQSSAAGKTPAVTLNSDYRNPNYGDERDLLRLTTADGERVDELKIGEAYDAHIYLCAHSLDDTIAAENVNLWVDSYFVRGDEIIVNVDVFYGTREEYFDPESYIGNTLYEGQIEYSRIFKVEKPEDIDFKIEFVGDVEIHNNGLLNGSDIDFERPRNNGNTFVRLDVGYDSQDGVLPSGADYACEVILQLCLSEVKYPDGFGGKTPLADPGATTAGIDSQDVGPNSGDGTGRKQNYY